MSGVVVIGATGGCGATTFACAIALARAGAGDSVLVVDLDPHGGGPSALWGIPAARALDDLCPLGDDLTPEHVDHLVHRHPTGIDVVAGARDASALTAWSAAALDGLVRYVTARPSWVVDAGRGDTPLVAALAARAELVVVLAPRSVEGARRLPRIPGVQDWRRAVGVATEIPASDRLPERALARALGAEFVATAARDPRGASRVAAAQQARGRGVAKVVAVVEGLR